MRGGLYGRDNSAGRIVPHRARDSCEGLHLGQDIRQQRRGRFTADGACVSLVGRRIDARDPRPARVH